MLATDGLRERVSADLDDAEIAREFLARDLPRGVRGDLATFLHEVRYPIAVRSSSLLEDSQFQPFAGVYATYMLPNNHPDPQVRLANLVDAVKLVYASAFKRGAKAYLAATGSRVEEERMAAVIQQVVGRRHEDVFYPDFAGVAHSTNFYPAARHGPRRGRGDARRSASGAPSSRAGTSCASIRVSPRGCRSSGPSTTGCAAASATSRRSICRDPAPRPARARTSTWPGSTSWTPSAHGTLDAVGSVYSADEQRITDGLGRPGVRLVSFAARPQGRRVSPRGDHDRAAGTRPRVHERAGGDRVGGGAEPGPGSANRTSSASCRSARWRSPAAACSWTARRSRTSARWSPPRSRSATAATGTCATSSTCRRTASTARARGRSWRRWRRSTGSLLEEGRPYILLGPGRWGTSDHWLGVPVRWDQISGARVIVETDLPDFRVTPSEGSHFFHNLTSFHVGYLTVNLNAPPACCDWAWLDAQPVAWAGTFLRRVRLEAPLEVVIDGRNRRAVVLRPA